MKTELIMKGLPVGQLKPAKYNPRKDLKPGDPAYEKIKRSLHDFGYVDPIPDMTTYKSMRMAFEHLLYPHRDPAQMF